MITLKLSGYTKDDIINLHEILLNAAIDARMIYGDTQPVRDIESSLDYLHEQIQSTEPGLRNPVSK